MKTAILMSGAMRSFERCLPNQAWMVYRHFPNADFFVSTEPDGDALQAELLDLRYPGRVLIDYTPQPPMAETLERLGVLKPWTAGEPYTHEPYSISVSPTAVVGQLWRLSRCWQFLTETKGHDYDQFVRIRPDLWFHSLRYHTAPGFDDAITPWWGRFGGLNDRFAILGDCAAEAYFTTFDKLGKLLDAGCPLHPESLVAASLEASDCHNFPTLRAVFSTLRKDGAYRGPEILAQDIADMC